MESRVSNLDEAAVKLGVDLQTLYTWFGRDASALHMQKLTGRKLDVYIEHLQKLQESIEAAKHARTKSEQARLDAIKGRVFENTVAFLLYQIDPYSVLRNKRTSTNEIDIILKKKIEYACYTDEIFPPRIFCECKNYSQSVSVTYTGKFISLLQVSHCPIGIIFSIEGLSARSKWSDSMGLCRKIALRERIYIVDFKFDDLIRVCDVPFVKIIDDKIEELKSDINMILPNHELCTDQDFINAR